MNRHALKTLPVLAVALTALLAGCADGATSSAKAPAAAAGNTAANSKPGADTTAQASSSTTTAPSSPEDLRRACLNVKTVNGQIFPQLFDHPNDPVAGGKIYADGAAKLREAGDGTPIEAQVEVFAAAMEKVAAVLATGQDVQDGSWLPKASGPLLKACEAYA